MFGSNEKICLMINQNQECLVINQKQEQSKGKEKEEEVINFQENIKYKMI